MKPHWLLCLGLLTVGCSHTVKYKLTDADRWTGAKIDKVIRVQTFVDQTPPPAMMDRPAQPDLHKPATRIAARTVIEDGRTWRINYRDGYKNHEIATGVTHMLARHLQHAGLFKNVIEGADAPADYELTGTITTYRAAGEPSVGAETAVMVGAGAGGLLGALVTAGATAGMKSEIRAAVELRAVALTDLQQTKPVWTDTISVSTNFTAHWQQADVPVVFHHADACLKQAVAELIQRLAAIPRP